MPNLLQNLASLTAKQVLAVFWAAALILSLINAANALSGAASAAMLLMYCGYPYVVILGLPRGIVRPALLKWCRPWFAVFVGFVAILTVASPFIPESGYQTPQSPATARDWTEVALAVVVNIAVFSPFFVGAAALNDMRWSQGQRAWGDSIPNFLALFFWPFGGAIHVHNRVRAVLHAA